MKTAVNQITATICIAILFIFPVCTLAAGNHLDRSFSSDGKVTAAFGSIFNPTDDRAADVEIQSDGRIVVAGTSDYDFAVMRFNSDGTLDTTFSGDGKVLTSLNDFDEARALAIQSDGKIVIGGYSGADFAILRYNTNGTLDTTFAGDGSVTVDFSGGIDIVEALAIQPDGKIVAVGLMSESLGGAKNWGLIRLNPGGTLDLAFDGNGRLATDWGGGDDTAQDVLVQSDGKIVVTGSASESASGENADFGIARYNANGALDTSFSGDGKQTVNPTGSISSDDFATCVGRTSDGKYVIGGEVNRQNSNGSLAVAKITSTGQLDPSFGDAGIAVNGFTFEDDRVSDLAIQSDGKIVLTFSAGAPSSSTIFGLLRYQTDGRVDPTFGTGGQLRTVFGTGNRLAEAVVFVPSPMAHVPNSLVAVGAYRSGSDFDFAVARYVLEFSAAPGDLTDDGQADYSVFRPSTGVSWILNSATNANFAYQFGTAGDLPAPGDYDRDGKTDIAIYRPSEGVWYVLRSSNLSYFAVPLGVSTDKPTQGDFDGDGRTDIAVYRPSTGVWYAQRSSDNEFVIVQYGVAEDKPTQADYDGDGVTDFAVFRPSEGVWYLRRSTYGETSQQFGLASDRPVPADYDRDGRADIAVWRSSNGFWYAINSQSESTSFTQFGTAGDIPTPADFDSDGDADQAVFRPSTGTWYVRKNSVDVAIVQFGLNGDIPLLSRYVPE